VAAVVVVDRLGELILVGPDRRTRAFAVAPRSLRSPDSPGSIPAALERALRDLPPDVAIRTDTERGSIALRRALGREVGLASLSELCAARSALPRPEPSAERRFLLALAASHLERVLNSPEEILISLAREEERLERSVGREARAAEAFLAPVGSPLEEYAAAWTTVRAALRRHHEELVERIRAQSRRVVPNLSALVGERIAARLVAAAGGLAPLARMTAPRLQLLGSRRRPSPDRGPRYGLLYRADRMDDVPPDRRGAYARTLASLAAIATRADATTRADLSRTLVGRRDRRVEHLRRVRR
jgi:hypothetical protein